VADRQAKLDVSLNLARVCECGVEHSELDRSFLENAMQVQCVVPALVVVLPAAVITVVPEVLDRCKGLWLFTVDIFNESVVYLFAESACSVLVHLQGLEDQIFFRRHDVGDVANALGGMRCGIDVNVDPAGVVCLAAGGAEFSHQFLDCLDVGVLADRAYQLALLAAFHPDARVPNDLPVAVLAVGDFVGVVGVADSIVGRSEVSAEGLSGCLASDPGKLDLDSEVLFFHVGVRLSCVFFVMLYITLKHSYSNEIQRERRPAMCRILGLYYVYITIIIPKNDRHKG